MLSMQSSSKARNVPRIVYASLLRPLFSLLPTVSFLHPKLFLASRKNSVGRFAVRIIISQKMTNDVASLFRELL